MAAIVCPSLRTWCSFGSVTLRMQAQRAIWGLVAALQHKGAMATFTYETALRREGGSMSAVAAARLPWRSGGFGRLRVEVDLALREPRQRRVGLLLFVQRGIEELHRLGVAELAPSASAYRARNLVVFHRLCGGKQPASAQACSCIRR